MFLCGKISQILNELFKRLLCRAEFIILKGVLFYVFWIGHVASLRRCMTVLPRDILFSLVLNHSVTHHWYVEPISRAFKLPCFE